MAAPGHDEAQRARPGLLRWTVSARLLAAMLIPIVALALVATSYISRRHDDVARARSVLSDLDRLDRLTHLRSALFAERVAAEMLVRRPPPEALAMTTFGEALISDPGSLERATDAALSSVDAADRPYSQAEMDATRADRASWQSTLSGITTHIGPFYDRTVAVVNRVAAVVRRDIIVLGNGELVAAGTVFDRSTAVPGAAGELLASLSDLWLAEPGRRPALQSAAAEAGARYEVLSGRLADSIVDPSGPVAGAWSGSMQMPPAMRGLLDDARHGALTGAERPPAEPVSVGLALLTGVDWIVAVDQLPSIASSVLHDAASAVAGDARSSERSATLMMLGLIAVSVATALVFARSIAMPVRRLTNHAQRVGAGRLDVEPLALRGPPDVIGASEAFNDVVGNLVLLEQKSHALAEGDFDSPALARPLPGRLGASLERSAQLLANSIQERQQLQRRLVHEATHDSLTGLANRAAVGEFLRSSYEQANPIAVVFVDLNNFKRINDRHGHIIGDAMLKVVAERLRAATPAGGLAARLGGDEFVVVIPSTDAQEAVEAAKAMVALVAEPAVVDGRPLRVGACAGVALSSDSFSQGLAAGQSAPAAASELLRRSDLAVYQAKQNTDASVAVYDEQLGVRLREQEAIETALSHALLPNSNELVLMFQPIVRSDTLRVAGIETLVRWDHPRFGRLQPDDFVPVAERSGLIISLDRWVLRQAVGQLREWADDRELGSISLSVNVSARSLLDPSFVDHVLGALDNVAISPHRLKLELTETALITDLETAAAQLIQLRAAGVRVSIDDFGTGYTSFAHLRAMPVDELKIDSSFVHGLPDDDSVVLIQMINDMAHHLHIPTVAEGIETVEQMECLQSVGCDNLQGYLFAPPLAPDDLVVWVREHASLGSVAPASLGRR